MSADSLERGRCRQLKPVAEPRRHRFLQVRRGARLQQPGLACGQIDVTFNATFLGDYEETTVNIDGSETVSDLGGNKLDSAMFADLRLSYRPSLFGGSLAVTMGFKLIRRKPAGLLPLQRHRHEPSRA